MFCVLSRVDGIEGDKISSGLAYLRRKDGTGGYVAESQVAGPKEKVMNELKARAEQMALSRNAEIGEIKYAVEELDIPLNNHGSCVVALVFLP